MKWVLVVAAVLALPACDLGLGHIFDPIEVKPQDCSALSAANWRFFADGELRVAVGESRRLRLLPAVESRCADALASVSWSVEDPEVASILAEQTPLAARDGWVTGVVPGGTSASARIVFHNGVVRELSQPVSVVPAEAPPEGGRIVAEGTRSFPTAPNTVFRACPIVTVPEAGEVFISIDWPSPLDYVGFDLRANRIQGPGETGCRGDVVHLVWNGSPGTVKPARAFGTVEAGEYGLNIGSGSESIRYEVWLVPS